MASIFKASNTSRALRHPVAALRFISGDKTEMHRCIILDAAQHLWGSGFDKNRWNSVIDELNDDPLPPPDRTPSGLIVGNSLNNTFGKWIWCCVRILQPEVMIETGVAHGSSSRIILSAMHRNQKGMLFSIDLPNRDTNKNYNFESAKPETGWMVADKLRDRWSLRLGEATELLPAVLKETGQTDIFFHDSDHSYAHMKFEFETSAPYIKTGGLLLSDDVHKNSAFEEFVTGQSWKALQFNKGGCAIAP